MKDNNTGSQLKNLKVDDDSLEAVSGGTQGDYVVRVSEKTDLYKEMNIMGSPVGSVAAGTILIGITKENIEWYKVPVNENFSRLDLTDRKCVFMDYLYIQSSSLNTKK